MIRTSFRVIVRVSYEKKKKQNENDDSGFITLRSEQKVFLDNRLKKYGNFFTAEGKRAPRRASPAKMSFRENIAGSESQFPFRIFRTFTDSGAFSGVSRSLGAYAFYKSDFVRVPRPSDPPTSDLFARYIFRRFAVGKVRLSSAVRSRGRCRRSSAARRQNIVRATVSYGNIVGFRRGLF